MMPAPKEEPKSDRDKSEYRLLYVGQDVEWFRRLKSVLGLPANRLVYCPGGSSVGHLLKSDIRYDLFLFDFDLLNEPGVEFVRLVRSLPHRHQTPIIIVAANEVIGRLEEPALSAGANEYLTKTEDISVVAASVQRHLRNSPLLPLRYS